MIQLRDYQQAMIDDARARLARVRRLLVQAPTGAGKTALASFMVGQSAASGRAAWFICHRSELVQQTSQTFAKFGIAHGFIAAGHRFNLSELVHVCSIDTLKNRLAMLPPPKLAIIDEAHHCSAAGWALVIEWLHSHGTRIVGLSATPQRLDGKGLDKHFDDIVLGPSVAWLIENGHLSPYRVFAPHVPDMKGVRKQMGDYSASDAAKTMDKPKLTGDAIAHWLKLCNGMRTVVFGCNVAHSQHLAEQFNAAGIPAAHIDGASLKRDRQRLIQDYAAGRIQVLTNVDLFGEGFDLSAIAQRDVTIDAVMQMRPTGSLSLHLQQVGRSLRPGPGKVAVILDHAGNTLRHGFPDDEREWSLDGREGGARKAANDDVPPPVICDGCFNAIRRPLPPACPHCGKPLRAEVKAIEVAEGELVEIDAVAKRQMRAHRLAEEWACKNIAELVALGVRRGYDSPQGWAFKTWARTKDRRMKTTENRAA